MHKVLYVNNDGGGFADFVEIAEGTTVQQFFAERVPNGRPQDYLIRVNRQPVAADQVLQEGDRVSAGDRFGLIRFGSRTDLYLPESLVPLVTEGQTMVGGETVIAEPAT